MILKVWDDVTWDTGNQKRGRLRLVVGAIVQLHIECTSRSQDAQLFTRMLVSVCVTKAYAEAILVVSIMNLPGRA